MLGADPGDRRRVAWLGVFAEVDPRINDRDPARRNALFFDHDPPDLLAQDDHRRGVAADRPFEPDVDLEADPAPEAVALILAPEQRVDLVDHRPAVPLAGEQGAVGPAVVLGVDEVEGELAVDPCQATDPVARVEGERGRAFEVLADRPRPRGAGLEVGQDDVDTPRLEGPENLDRQHRRAVVFARDREGSHQQDAHRKDLRRFKGSTA